MEQTAVEWLIHHWMELDKKYYGGEIGRIDYRNRREAIQKESASMFKQQIEDAYSNGRVDEQFKGTGASFYLTKSEQYYNKTFKNK